MANLPTKQELEDLYYKKKLSIRHIAEQLHKGHTLIWELFKEYGIENRGRSDYVNIEEQIQEILNRFTNQDAKEWVERWYKQTKQKAGLQSRRQAIYTLLRVLDPLPKPIKQIIDEGEEDKGKKVSRSEDVILNLFNHLAKEYGKNGRPPMRQKKAIKSFFKWCNDNVHPQCTKWIELGKSIEEEKADIEPLTIEERRLIIKHAPHPRARICFAQMDRKPLRPKDLSNCNVGDIKFDNYGYKLKVHSKTKKGFRTLMFIHEAPYMKEYLATHEYKDDPNAPLFYSYSFRDKNGEPTRLDWHGMNYDLQEACRRAGIKRKITLYHFRKSTTMRLLQDSRYTPKEIQIMGGWKNIGTLMDTYGKITDEMVCQKDLEVNGLVDKKGNEIKEEPLEEIICPRCHTKNTIMSDSCSNCWLPLSEVGIKKAVMTEKVRNKTGFFNVDINAAKEAIRELIKNKEITKDDVKVLFEGGGK